MPSQNKTMHELKDPNASEVVHPHGKSGFSKANSGGTEGTSRVNWRDHDTLLGPLAIHREIQATCLSIILAHADGEALLWKGGLPRQLYFLELAWLLRPCCRT